MAIGLKSTAQINYKMLCTQHTTPIIPFTLYYQKLIIKLK